MKALSLQMRFYAILGSAAAVLGLLVLGIYFYLFAWVVNDSSVIQGLKTEIASLEARKEQAKVRQHDIDGLADDAGRVAGAFFDAKNPLPLFTSIDGIASTTGVVVDMRLGDAKKDPKDPRGPEQEFQVTVSGQYQNIRNFIGLLELLPFESRFSSVHMELAGDVGMNLTGSFRVAVH